MADMQEYYDAEIARLQQALQQASLTQQTDGTNAEAANLQHQQEMEIERQRYDRFCSCLNLCLAFCI